MDLLNNGKPRESALRNAIKKIILNSLLKGLSADIVIVSYGEEILVK